MSSQPQYEVTDQGFEILKTGDEKPRPRLGIDWNFESPADTEAAQKRLRTALPQLGAEDLEIAFSEILDYVQHNNYSLDVCFAEGGVLTAEHFWEYIKSLNLEDHIDSLARLEFRFRLASFQPDKLDLMRQLGTVNCHLEFDLEEIDREGWLERLARIVEQLSDIGIIASPVGIVSTDTRNKVTGLIDQFVKHRINRIGFIFPTHYADTSDGKPGWAHYVCLRAIERLIFWRHAGYYIEWCGEHYLFTWIQTRVGLKDTLDSRATPLLGRQRLRLAYEGSFFLFQPPWIQLGYARSSPIKEMLNSARKKRRIKP